MDRVIGECLREVRGIEYRRCRRLFRAVHTRLGHLDVRELALYDREGGSDIQYDTAFFLPVLLNPWTKYYAHDNITESATAPCDFDILKTLIT
jgi:hypothetical protein